MLRKFRRNKWKKYKNLLRDEKLSSGFIKPNNWIALKRYETYKSRKFHKILKSKQLRKQNKVIVEKNLNHGNRLELPKIINFTNGWDNIKVLYERIKAYHKTSTSNISINLSKLNEISINGLVYLVSEIDRIKNHKKSLKVTDYNKEFKYYAKYGVNPNNEKLKYFLSAVGYWGYFGIKNPYKIQKNIEDDYFLSIKTDTLSKSFYVAEVREFISQKIDFLKDDLIEEYFDDAITEAMANSVEHGYIKRTPTRTRGKWWFCGHYNKIDNYLEFSFKDYGVGLRKTLEYNADDSVQSFIRNITNRTKSDAEIIKLLVNDQLPKYKGKKDKIRGYGFKKFKEFASKINYDCEMKIISGRGQYKYISSLSNEEERIDDMDFPIDGVLISWKLYLKGKSYDKKAN